MKPRRDGSRRGMGPALTLDKFATAKISKYNKKEILQKQRNLNFKKVNKYVKLKNRLEVSGQLSAKPTLVRCPQTCPHSADCLLN